MKFIIFFLALASLFPSIAAHPLSTSSDEVSVQKDSGVNFKDSRAFISNLITKREASKTNVAELLTSMIASRNIPNDIRDYCIPFSEPGGCTLGTLSIFASYDFAIFRNNCELIGFYDRVNWDGSGNMHIEVFSQMTYSLFTDARKQYPVPPTPRTTPDNS